MRHRPSGRRAESFARLIDTPGAVADPSLGGLGALGDLVAALRTAGRTSGPTGPEPAFRAELRQRLVAVATVQPVDAALSWPTDTASRRSLSGRARNRVAALAGTVAVATSVAGVGIASARALPGDPFYGVKRATEAVQLWTAHGDDAKGKRHLEFAQTRLAEARALHDPSAAQLASELRAMDTQTRDGTADLLASYRSSRSTQPLTDLDRFARSQLAGLVALSPRLPVSLRPAEQAETALLASVDTDARRLAVAGCPACAGSGSSGSPAGGVPLPSAGATSPATSRHHHRVGHPAPPTGPGVGGTATTPGTLATPTPTPARTRSGGVLPSVTPLPTHSGIPLPLPTLSVTPAPALSLPTLPSLPPLGR
jgi:hypothetical protein